MTLWAMIDVTAEPRPESPNRVALLCLFYSTVSNQIVEIHFHAFNERRFAHVEDRRRKEDYAKL